MKSKKIILKEIEENEKINRYKQLEEIVLNDIDLNNKINEIKKIQQQIIHAEKLDKSNKLELLKKEYDEKLNEVYEYPLMAEYLDLQAEINEMLQYVKDIIEKGLNRDFNNKKR